jgi:diguanylate cyclase (GGDEF)-like protein/PAS domain S-box-containing protein
MANAREYSEIELLRSELQTAQQRISALEDKLTQQRIVEQGLQEVNRFREAIIEQASEGVFVYRDIPVFPFVEFTVWNHRMSEITGYTMAQINELGWYQTIYRDPEVQARARTRMERMRKGENLVHEHWEITRADDEKRLLSVSTSILKQSDGSEHVLGLMYDFTADERLQVEESRVQVDDLTQLKNYNGFKETAKLLLGLAARQGEPVTVLYLDVDDFKSLNDTLGHLAGDWLLRTVGGVLSGTIRSTDVAGRIGGDEFSAILLGASASKVEAFIKRLHGRLVGELRDYGWKNGVSMGAAVYLDSVPDCENALKDADALMHEAKRKGKNRLVYKEFGDRGRTGILEYAQE